MGVFGTNPGQSISGLLPANRDHPPPIKQQKKEPKKKDQPPREGVHVELSHPAPAHEDKPAPHPQAPPANRARLDLEG